MDTPTASSLVTVTNNSDRDFTYRYVTDRVTLRAGMQMVIPYAHMVLIAGDPFATLHNDRRSEEVLRIKYRYGVDADPNWQDHPDVPNLTFEDSDGNEYMTIIKDPMGAAGVMPPGELDLSSAAAVQREIERLKSQMNQLMRAQNAAEAADASLARSDASEDAPPDPAMQNAVIPTAPAKVASRPRPTPTVAADTPDRPPVS